MHGITAGGEHFASKTHQMMWQLRLYTLFEVLYCLLRSGTVAPRLLLNGVVTCLYLRMPKPS